MTRPMKTLKIDWAVIPGRETFYEVVLAQMDAPEWHGHSLGALQDSWVNGGVCESGPPFCFLFRSARQMNPALEIFIRTVEEIATQSVEEHGGCIEHVD